MITLLAISFQLIGYYAIYNGSEEAELRLDIFSRWLQRNSAFSQIAGIMIIINAFVLFLTSLGIAAGLLTGVFVLLTISSMVNILSPLLKQSDKNAGQ